MIQWWFREKLRFVQATQGVLKCCFEKNFLVKNFKMWNQNNYDFKFFKSSRTVCFGEWKSIRNNSFSPFRVDKGVMNIG